MVPLEPGVRLRVRARTLSPQSAFWRLALCRLSRMSLEVVAVAAPGLGFCGVLIDHGLGDALDHRLRALRKVWRNARAAEVQVCRIDLVQV